MKKIRIAITADTHSETTNIINLVNAPFAPRSLVEVFADIGVIPIILPDVVGIKEEDYLDLFDGIVIPGGADISPWCFGEEPIWSIGKTNYKRDMFELKLVKAAIQAGKPILGLCRGCQLINVAMGGTVYQDLPSQCQKAYIQHSQKAPGAYPTHHIQIKRDSMLFKSLGETAFVNSRHHQAIHCVGKGLVVTATSPDGVIEAVESQEGRPIMGVQWHPENMWQEHEEMKRLFTYYVQCVLSSVAAH